MAFRLRIQNGVVAIYENSNDAPFSNPLGNLSRVKFHSGLDYINVVSIRNYTLSLPAIGVNGSGQGTGGRRGLRTNLYTLGAHGRSGIPFVIGQLTVNGVRVICGGSVPVAKDASYLGLPDWYSRFVAIGADATNITAYEYSVQPGYNGGQWMPRAARNIPVTVYITDLTL